MTVLLDVLIMAFAIFSAFFFPQCLLADETAPQMPKFYLNGKPADVTVQDLSGLVTRPLRLLIKKNNLRLGAEFIQVFAIGVRENDELAAELPVPVPGVRATVYQILREKGGPRYLSMKTSEYFSEAKTGQYKEHIEPFDEDILIIIFEKTDSADEKNIQIRYFEERVRHLVIASYKTNLLLSSLKLKMKDFSGDETEKFFERDAQLLIDRLVNPQQIFLVRLWHLDKK